VKGHPQVSHDLATRVEQAIASQGG
jgi:hypothetical protein